MMKFRNLNIPRKIIVAFVIMLTISILVMEFSSRREVVVLINDDGFTPSLIKIQPGQKVVWRVSGDGSYWPASNYHPTHTQYETSEPGCLGSVLDACRALKNGQSFEFTFKQSGIWGMHDHLAPGNIMSVNVEKSRPGWIGRLQIIWSRVINGSSRVTDHLPVAEEFSNLSYDAQLELLKTYAQEDPDAAWSYLKSAFIINGQVVQPAHEFGHVIGNAAYAKYGVPGVRVCDASFGYGCFHGVTEQAVQRMSSTADLKIIEQECTIQSDVVNRQNCYHGIGHGLASVNDLSLSPALQACDTLQDNNKEFCHDGVMMEHVYGIGSQQISRTEPWKICEKLNSDYHKACGNYQAVRLSAAGWSFEEIIKSCASTDLEVLEKQCSRASGYASVNNYWQQPDTIISQCAFATKESNNDWCLTAAASDFAFQAYNNWRQAAGKLCNAIKRAEFRQECSNEVIGNMR